MAGGPGGAEKGRGLTRTAGRGAGVGDTQSTLDGFAFGEDVDDQTRRSLGFRLLTPAQPDQDLANST